MLSSLYSHRYSSVNTEDLGDRKGPDSTRERVTRQFRVRVGVIVGTVLLISLLYILATSNVSRLLSAPSYPPKSCLRPNRRREWREVSERERDEYLSAVECLHRTPSPLHVGAKLSDDFPWAHSLIGSSGAHYHPQFLPWHRYFIHLYENALIKDCGYSGHLLYWDWSLDYQNFSAAPIWDLEHGFSGDGERTSRESIDGAYCVKEGRFGDYEVQIYGDQAISHCLSRAFGKDTKDRFWGPNCAPDNLENILEQTSYYEFLMQLEKGPHNDIPIGIGGDWLRTGPNGMMIPRLNGPSALGRQLTALDPVFFLHHAQIDRLWWLWQSSDLAKRRYQYQGPPEATDMDGVHLSSLKDSLKFSPLADDVEISVIMDTEGGLLCYEY